MSYIYTDYKGETGVPTHLNESGGGDADLYCPNDDCPGIELELDEDSDDNVPMEIGRVAWESGWHRPTGPSYASGGDPGYSDRPECPVCGEGGEPL